MEDGEPKNVSQSFAKANLENLIPVKTNNIAHLNITALNALQ